MIAGLPASARRLLAVLLLLAGLAAVLGAAALPFAVAGMQEAERAGIERRIGDLSRRLPARESLLAQERLLRGGNQIQRLLLRGSTPSVVTAQLQGDLAALASAMGAEVTSVQILEPAASPGFREVGLRLTLGGDISAVRDFLYAVETRTPLLLLRSFSLNRSDAGEAVPGGSERLTATMEIRGFMVAATAS